MADDERPEEETPGDPVGVDPDTGDLVFDDELEGFDLNDEIVARRPIAMVAAEGMRVGQRSMGPRVFVLCDDGSCYMRDSEGAWREQEPIPGTLREFQLSEEAKE